MGENGVSAQVSQASLEEYCRAVLQSCLEDGGSQEECEQEYKACMEGRGKD